MATKELQRFLNIARDYTDLLIDLTVQDVINYAQLIALLDRYDIAPAHKQRMIDDLRATRILEPLQEQNYAINTTVANLINEYERRGHLANATYLSEQLTRIALSSQQLQLQLIATPPDSQLIRESVEDLANALRLIRTSAQDHYFACMRTLGDLKRNQTQANIDTRISSLQETQRRYIEPFRELIDTQGTFTNYIGNLRRTMSTLSPTATLIRESLSLAQAWQRLRSDLFFVEHTVLQNFGHMIHTASDLLTSLLNDKSLKEAVAYSLANLPQFLHHHAATTVIGQRRTSNRVANITQYASFLDDILAHRLLPNPQPLHAEPVTVSADSDLLISDQHLRSLMQHHTPIASWPHFVSAQFPTSPAATQLNAIAYPLLRYDTHICINAGAEITCTLSAYTCRLTDFAVVWQEDPHV